MKVKPKHPHLEAEQWLIGKKVSGLRQSSVSSRCMELRTTEGPTLVRHGDWIIRDAKGAILGTMCDRLFRETYEPAGE